MMMRGLLKITILAMILHGDLVRAEVTNQAKPLIGTLRVMIVWPRGAMVPTTRGQAGVDTNLPAGGDTPLGEAVTPGGRVTAGETRDVGASGTHGARRLRIRLPPMAVPGMIARMSPGGTPATPDGTTAPMEPRGVLRDPEDQVKKWWSPLSTGKSMRPT